MLLKMQRKGFEHARAVVKIQCAQRRPPLALGVVPHRGRIGHPAQNAKGLACDRRANRPTAAI